MQSVLEEITKLRNGTKIMVDYANCNRYGLVLQESDGSKTAYYFSTPIYNQCTRKMLDLKFFYYGSNICSCGSNADIIISDNVTMKNADGYCKIELPQKPIFNSEKRMNSGNIDIFPTTNGVALKCTLKANEKIDFYIDVGQPFLNVRANDRCFSLMKEDFRPFVVFSCIGSLDTFDNVISPAKMGYQKLTDKRYKITISATSPLASSVLFEVNLYENKLFQDTTVESKNPLTNNAFGSTAFIGNSSVYGEQWLYSRLDYSKISEISDKRVQKATLHMPKFNENKARLRAFNVSARFCSFGSNWNNKITESSEISDSSCDGGYHSLDITPLLVEQKNGRIIKSEGLILKPKIKQEGFSVITTADSYFAPQILEINFR